MMTGYDSKAALLQAIVVQSMKMQDNFLNQFVGKPIDLGITVQPDDAAELLKISYRKLLENVRDKIKIELEMLNDYDDDIPF